MGLLFFAEFTAFGFLECDGDGVGFAFVAQVTECGPVLGDPSGQNGQEVVPVPEIAKRLRVSQNAVYVWRRRWLADGAAGLVSKGPSGADCRLSPEQQDRLADSPGTNAVNALVRATRCPETEIQAAAAWGLMWEEVIENHRTKLEEINANWPMEDAPQEVTRVLTEESAGLGARAVRAGARSVLPRGVTAVVLQRTVEATIDGQTVIPAPVAVVLATGAVAAGDTDPVITADQLVWLRHLADGTTVAELARLIGYSERAMYRLLACCLTR